MSKSSSNSNTDFQSTLSKYNFKNIISCKCGKIHRFCVVYDKKYKICFFCEDELFIVDLENIYNNPDYSIKCTKCNKPIDFKKGLFRTKNEKKI